MSNYLRQFMFGGPVNYDRATKRVNALADGLGIAPANVVARPLKYRRCYHGYWQRSSGGWSWFAADANGVEVFGSSCALGDVWRAFRKHGVAGVEITSDGGLGSELYPVDPGHKTLAQEIAERKRKKRKR